MNFDHASQDKEVEFETVEIVEGVVLFKGRITGQEAASLLEDDRAEANDLIPGVYEGAAHGMAILASCHLSLSMLHATEVKNCSRIL
jgi:hypothetical protein